MTRRKQRSCYQCRSHHLKCDGEDPCTNCRARSRQCSKEVAHVFSNGANQGILRRGTKYDLSFEQGQRWIAIPQSVRFASDNDASNTSTTKIVDSSSSSIEGIVRPDRTTDSESTSSTRSLYGQRYAESTKHYELIDNKGTSELSFDKQLRSSTWWINGFNEALLLRHYTTNLANWFDEADVEKNFTVAIAEQAQDCASLLNAILAFSAHHLYIQGRLPEEVGLHYTDACYKILLPQLPDNAFIPSALATVFLLRFTQQMTGFASPQRVNGPKTEHHTDVPESRDGQTFLGLDVFLDALRGNIDSRIHAAIFVNMFRMYTHQAFINHRPLDLLESSCDWLCHELPIPASSHGWEWKALMICCHVLNFAYDDQPRTLERWMEVDSEPAEWRLMIPSYFDPIFEEDAMEGEPFPKILFSQDLYVSAWMYHYLAKLLSINNIPAAQPKHDLPSKVEIESRSYTILRRICGIATCHATSVPTLLKASLAIFYSGRLLKTKPEQEAAYALLIKADSHFPGLQPRQNWDQLRSAWGWTA